MQAAKLIRLATVFMVVFAVLMAVLILLAVWFRWHPYRLARVIKRIPTTISESIASLSTYTLPERVPTRDDGVPSAEFLGSWSAFRGDNRDAIVKDNTPLLTQLNNAAMPPVRWGLPLGEGYAGAAVRHGCVYLLDYDEASGSGGVLFITVILLLQATTLQNLKIHSSASMSICFCFPLYRVLGKSTVLTGR